MVSKNKKTFFSKFNHGFTIVELLIVIVVIGVLAAIVIVAYNGVIKKATIATLTSDLSNASSQLKVYKLSNRTYPTALDADNCPITPVVDNSLCLKSSSDNTFSYGSDGKTFALNEINSRTNDIVYNVTEKTVPAPGKACFVGFVTVPDDSTYGASNICIMKYEAKNDGSGKVISSAAGYPWTSIDYNNANTAAKTACVGCHLVTEAEWMTLAKNLLSVNSNWSGGSVGSGFVYNGHNDNGPSSYVVASTDDNDGYYKTNNVAPSDQRRTLTLSNGDVIWDIAGNVREWMNDQISTQKPGVLGGGGAYREWPTVTTTGVMPVSPFPVSTGINGAADWTNATNGIGTLYSNTDVVSLYVPVRGGSWNDANAGVLSLYLGRTPTNVGVDLGFRVAQ